MVNIIALTSLLAHKLLQVKPEVFALWTKNSPEINIRVMHPDDDIFAIFDLYKNSMPEPIVVGPNNAVSYMYLSMRGTKEDWDINDELAGKKKDIHLLYLTKSSIYM